MNTLETIFRSYRLCKSIWGNNLAQDKLRDKLAGLEKPKNNNRQRRGSRQTGVNYKEINSLRKNWSLVYYYYVKNDLARCAIEVISSEIEKQKFVVADTRFKGRKRFTSNDAKNAQAWFDAINIDEIICEAGPSYALFSNGVLRIKRNIFGKQIGLEPISWLDIEPIEDSTTGEFIGFRYTTKRGRVELPYEDVVHILPSMTDPADPRFGIPRMVACMDSLGCMDDLYKYWRSLLQTGDRKGQFINFKTDGDFDEALVDEMMDELKDQFLDVRSAVEPVITKNAEIHTSSQSRQTPFDELPKITAKQVSRGFMIPEKYLNLSEAGQLGSNRAVDDRNRLDEAIISYLMPICRSITKAILWENAGLTHLRLLPAKIVTPITLERARTIDIPYRVDVITWGEWRLGGNYDVNPDDPRVDMYYSDIKREAKRLDIEILGETLPDEVNPNYEDGEDQRQGRDS